MVLRITSRLALVGLLWGLGMSSELSAKEPAGFSVESTEAGVFIKEAGQKVLFYQKQPQSQNGRYKRANYVHPLYDLKGDVLTEDFPADHRHHRGIFWAWHQLWVGDKKLGDAWTTKDFLAKVQSVKVDEQNPKSVAIHADVRWTSDLLTDDQNRPVPVVDEETTITVHAKQETLRLVDFEIRLKALKPGVKIGGSEDVKGYGGFSVRIKLSPETKFRDPQGEVKPKTTAVKAGPWLDVATPAGGVAILDHPQNPGYPEPWILREQRSMQNPAYPGRNPVALSQTDPLVFKYRLVIHEGPLNGGTLNRLQQEWAKTNSSKP